MCMYYQLNKLYAREKYFRFMNRQHNTIVTIEMCTVFQGINYSCLRLQSCLCVCGTFRAMRLVFVILRHRICDFTTQNFRFCDVKFPILQPIIFFFPKNRCQIIDFVTKIIPCPPMITPTKPLNVLNSYMLDVACLSQMFL